MKVINFLLLITFISCAATPKEDPIQGPLEARQEKFGQCYFESNSYQGREAKNQGIVMTEFIITREGAVKEAKIKNSDFKDSNLHACLLDQIRKIKFQKLAEETVVHQPITFAPVKK